MWWFTRTCDSAVRRREKSIVALDLAMKADKRISWCQKQADVDDPKAEDLYRVGTVATILQLQAAGRHRQGAGRRVDAPDRETDRREFFSAKVTAMPDVERYEEREMDVLTVRSSPSSSICKAEQESPRRS